jgi:putative NIF3 family GTP cyclohydrolase 1 type 2
MTIQQVIDKILAYHPNLGEREATTCDTLKCGDPNAECTGIVTTCAPSIEVIRKTAELGYNLIIPHEPAFYSHMDKIDWLAGQNSVFDEKLKLLNEHGIAIWRDHDHIHAHNPDGIFYGVVKELGWESYRLPDAGHMPRFRIPETTVRELALHLKQTFHLTVVRIAGNLDAKVSTIGFGAHLITDPSHESTQMLDRELDVMIPGELIDWTTASYARDAGQLGKCKALIYVDIC